jgi:nitroreductase
MNDTVELMSRRRSVAPIAMTGPGPNEAELRRILTLGLRVPDHGKLTPWRIIVFEGAAREHAGAAVAELYKTDNPDVAEDRLDFERKRLARAPVVLGVVSRAAPHVKIPEWEQILSAGAVCMNLTLAANALGFRTAWQTEWMAYDRRFLRRIGVGEHEKMAGFLHIGRGGAPDDRPRPNLDDVVSRFE